MTEPARSDPELLNSATGAGLIYFCDIMIKRNEMTKGTGSALRTGCKKVLDTEEDPDDLNLRNLDMEALLRRFRNKNRIDLNDNSLRTYEQRFKQTVEMYLKFIDGDADWNPVKARPGAGAGKSPTAKATKPGTVVEIKPGATTPASEPPSEAATAVPPTPGPGRMLFPIPLRPGRRALLDLPEDLTEQEAKKVANVVAALATAGQLALPPGSSDS